MSIKRIQLHFEKDYTQLPNAWARDKRLSRKARGLLVEIMSHRIGWEITVETLVKGGPEGRDAISGGIKELIALGYIVRTTQRAESGKFDGIDYVINDPWADETPGQTADGFPVSGSPVSGSPADGESAAKKTSSSEDHLSEDHEEPLAVGSAADQAKPRTDVLHLVKLLAELMTANGTAPRTIPASWSDAARLLLDRDGHPLAEAEQVLRWCQADTFWSTNVLSMATFRKQYLRLRAKQRAEAAGGPRRTQTAGEQLAQLRLDLDALNQEDQS
ncbi:helix-turn-helix domain-containing protein [Clavibacter michiganensis subsp. michiganensis]|uniref:helix-turn-helix domain-containing protein n=1 Tax=Clavibacter michiganensis TaxID=28447 RepID=UPI001C64EF0C|nr:helix-turn-helix domain-containing protein [Clavibacter michiganensis]MBW8025321.1 helix-turn-helix domain-containing protein [Clavibacter michiganensis subsp. michiganensis]